jgi:hypothetical protein
MLRNGTATLLNLHRRALADGRLQLAEGACVAALAGVLLGLEVVETEWSERIAFSHSTPLLVILCVVAWLAVGFVLSRLARAAQQQWCGWVLAESGLLYLALEHEVAEYLRPLRRREGLLRGRYGGAGLSFRARLYALLLSYPACAAVLGWRAWDARWLWAERLCALTGLGCGAWLAWRLSQLMLMVLNSWAGGEELNYPALKPLGALTLLAMLASFTLAHARRTGLWLAAVELLHGEVQHGAATLTRG